ncbi:MAG: hypothetical protein ACRDKX_03505 [Solirubrobacterales bacterium]
MAGNADRDLLERATVALERQEAAFERQEAAFERQERAFNEMMRRWELSDARAEERHRRLLERQERSERIFVGAIGDIEAGTARRLDEIADRLSEMGEAIRANTRAVLSVLDRLEPGTA